MTTLFSIVLLFILSLLCYILHPTSASAGWCYQCDSRNPRCGMQIDQTIGIDKTPCNGQCYTYLRKNILYRGCSWEHGFMTAQTTFTAVYEKDGLWLFCDTPLCNSNAAPIMDGMHRLRYYFQMLFNF
ncbi:unnamed protein product [Rotaria magnacalcarata]